MLCTLISRRRLHESDAVQKRRGVEPRVLYLLDRWFFQLLPSVIDLRDAFVDVQHSGYASWIVGDYL